MTTAHGRCLCGDIQFTATLPSKWVAHCHCTMCQRAHGAAFVTWVGLEAASCRLDDPEQRLRWYPSSPGAERGLCGRCGSTLFFRAERWPGELHVARANFDTAIDREPQAHVFWDTHVDWLASGADDGLPRLGAAEVT